MSDMVVSPQQALATVTPMDMIALAQAKGDVPMMMQLFELKLRVEADEARKAFNSAMSQFKANAPVIVKNKHVTHNDFWHATLDECVSKITPALAEVGIRHRWDIDQSKAPQITVTCILSHELGYSESTPLTASADGSGSKNAIQAVGSAVTYLQRYTLLAATGLAAADTDDDGKGAGKQGLPESEIVQMLDGIRACNTEADLQRVWTSANVAAEHAKDQAARLDFGKAKNERWKQIKLAEKRGQA